MQLKTIPMEKVFPGGKKTDIKNYRYLKVSLQHLWWIALWCSLADNKNISPECKQCWPWLWNVLIIGLAESAWEPRSGIRKQLIWGYYGYIMKHCIVSAGQFLNWEPVLTTSIWHLTRSYNFSGNFPFFNCAVYVHIYLMLDQAIWKGS